ncbi:MAG: HAD family phosphatase [Firmicutes bacterium]|nr:HAD family phosphatase [Bacillota bacterium]
MIRLVAIDIDDTLLLPDRTISSRVGRAIRAVRDLGCLVVLATGRMFCAALPYAVDLGLKGPLITYQGALLKTADRQLLRHLVIPASVLKPLLQWLESEPVHINLYVEDQLYVAEMNDVARRYAAHSRIEVKEVGCLSRLPVEAATKVVAIGDPVLLAGDLQEQARAKFGRTLAINRSYPHFLEFGHQQATKSQALAWLGETFDIEPAAMLAIGDAENDIDMLQFAGIGIAMGNASPVVQAVADYIAPSNTEDGVAIALEKYFNLVSRG